ncbi:TRAP transporter substrate-binding protein [Maledivibacter halophilus]|uniref:Tripartite ATP-independent transporter solute receptor, DctP family n=1 Tax=Maledivibacter halophilus TaxID=36842 RepID=A0A1T5KQD8_9FIRM|nr:TRAP transporter substrate-binding protein [Maledivibacter halophilus]SKC65870.1 tripartite ATP-independent transporter solute receptor, DctP family [Maledivibacter halophilus]
MNRRKIVSLLLASVVVLSVILTGCQGSGDTNSEKVVKLQLSHQVSPKHSINETAMKFAELVKEKSEGTMEIEIFPSGSLGTERENLEALGNGSLDMAVIAVEFYPALVEEAGVFVLPYMYDNYEHQTAVLKGEAGKMLSDMILDKTGARVLSYYPLAFRQVVTTDKPIHTVEDIKGLKIRVPESPTYVNTFTLLGAAPTPVAWGETYTALETNVVSGMENTPESMYSASMHEVVKYINITDHISAPTTFSISDQVFEDLTEEQKTIISEAAQEATDFGLELTIANDTKFREELAKNIEVIETDKESMRNAINYDAFNVMKLESAKKLKELIDAAR